MTIGFFDSGVGGLRVMERTMQLLPDYDYVFYGDTKHLPYGDKTEEEVYRLTRNAVWYLFSAHDAKLVVVACNTASSESLRRLQDEFVATQYPDRRVLGVIIPTIETILDTKVQNPLLIATTRTIDSHKFEKELTKRNSEMVLKVKATPYLVPLIEAGKLEEAVSALEILLADHIVQGGDSVILGCTHYTLLTPYLRAKYGNKLRFFSQDEIIPEKLKDYLKCHQEIESTLSRHGSREVMWSATRNQEIV